MNERDNVFHRITEHVMRHPFRLLATGLVIVGLTWGFALFAIVQSLDNAREGRIVVCKSVNELRREIIVAAADLGADPLIILRLAPSEDCESLP